ncbi:MAG: hypothetical protein AB7T74_05225 [Clostridia bacterium]|jgi:hypothetical protein|nr:hypothetical protein [Spirochaetia bacterium]
MKKFTRLFIAVLVMLLAVQVIAAQTSPDPAIQKAKEETVVIFDLGRMFGYLNTMEKDPKVAALSNTQLTKLYDIMVELRNTTRVETAQAQILLTSIEDDILTPAQLMAADKLAVAKEAGRTNVQGSGAGSSANGGTSSMASYVAGGDFNPIIDPTKTMGKDFTAFYDYVARKLGRK